MRRSFFFWSSLKATHLKFLYFYTMRPRLKLNHLTTLHDARYCSAVGVELLGFDLSESSDFYLEPKAIKEIMDWLSGPRSIGQFQYETPDQIKSTAEKAGIELISLPVDYPLPTASEFEGPLAFRSTTYDGQVVARLSELIASFPEAYFEFPAPDATEDLLKIDPEILERSILHCASPDPVYQILKHSGLKPYAFSLGDFVEEADGMIDYASCDDFIEEYQAVIL